MHSQCIRGHLCMAGARQFVTFGRSHPGESKLPHGGRQERRIAAEPPPFSHAAPGAFQDSKGWGLETYTHNKIESGRAHVLPHLHTPLSAALSSPSLHSRLFRWRSSSGTWEADKWRQAAQLAEQHDIQVSFSSSLAISVLFNDGNDVYFLLISIVMCISKLSAH